VTIISVLLTLVKQLCEYKKLKPFDNIFEGQPVMRFALMLAVSSADGQPYQVSLNNNPLL
jgi:hypothetical protein